MSRMPVYVAGKYNDTNVMGVLDNMRLGINQCLDLIEMGFAPFCPWLDFQYGLVRKLDYEDYIEIGLSWLEMASAVLVLDNWQDSPGTQKEMEAASEMGIPVFFTVDELKQFQVDYDAADEDWEE